MNIIFFGTGPYVLPIVKSLHQRYNLKLVVTTEKENNAPIISYCKSSDIHYLSVQNLKDEFTISQLKILNAPVAILANFRCIVPSSIIDIFPKGIINIHPSWLPKYRGTTPGQTAILNGDKTTGVSIIRLDQEVDHGPLLAQETMPLLSNDTAETFYYRAFQKGTNILDKVLDDYISGQLKPIPQDHTNATFTKTLTKQDGYIDSDQPMKREKLIRMVRAYYPWPGVWTRLRLGYGGQAKGKRVKFLPEGKIQVEGKKPMTIKDFLNGYPMAKDWLEKFTN